MINLLSGLLPSNQICARGSWGKQNQKWRNNGMLNLQNDWLWSVTAHGPLMLVEIWSTIYTRTHCIQGLSLHLYIDLLYSNCKIICGGSLIISYLVIWVLKVSPPSNFASLFTVGFQKGFKLGHQWVYPKVKTLFYAFVLTEIAMVI